MDYIELIKNINYFSFITAFAKWIFLALVLSILVLIICSKLSLFKRRKRVARILVKLYYLIIPIYFIIFAIKFAPVRNTQLEINSAIDNKKEVVTAFAYDFLSSIIADSLLTQKKSAKEIVDSYLNNYNQLADSVVDSRIPKIGKRFIAKLKIKVEFVFLKKLVESKIVKETSGFIGINKKTGKELYETDLYDLFKEGEIVDIFKKELNSFFWKFYKFMFLIFGLGLLLPAVEIIISKFVKY